MNKLSFKEKAGYASGDFAGNLIWQTLMFFLPSFYSDTFGLPLAAAGTLFLVVRIFDAINDPLMGIIADRTTTRWGKFRPYLLWMALPYAIVGVLMFYTPDFSVNGKIAYAYITYILMMLFFTAITIPYNALSGVMTSNHLERTSLNSFRFVSAFAGGIVVQGATLFLVMKLGRGNQSIGWTYTMVLYGAIALGLFFISFKSTRERVKPIYSEKNLLRKDLGDLIRNRPWLLLFAFSFFFLVFIAIRSGIIVYYFQYFLHRKEEASVFMVAGTIVTMLTTLTAKYLSGKFGKRNALLGCTLIMGFSLVGFYFVKPGDYWLLYATQIVFALVSGPPMPLIWSMLADSADYNEWKTGRRATGLIFSAATLSQKFGVAIGGSLLMIILLVYHYQPKIAQTDDAILGIRLLMSFYPAIIALAASAFLLFYKLDAKNLKQIEADLKSNTNK